MLTRYWAWPGTAMLSGKIDARKRIYLSFAKFTFLEKYALYGMHPVMHPVRPLQHDSLFLITTVGVPGRGRAVIIIIHYVYIYTDNLNAKRRTRG